MSRIPVDCVRVALAEFREEHGRDPETTEDYGEIKFLAECFLFAQEAARDALVCVLNENAIVN